MALQGMIFDIDGTLANTLPICIRGLQDAYRMMTGKDIAPEKVTALFGINEEGIMQHLTPDCWEAAVDAYVARYEQLHAEIPHMFPGLQPAFARLKAAGVPMAVVTGKGRRSALVSIRALGLEPYIEQLEVGKADGLDKAAGMRRVVQAWGADPTQVAYLGDTLSDMAAAQEAGVMPLGAAWAKTTEIVPGDWQTLRSTADFIAWLEKALCEGVAEPC